MQTKLDIPKARMSSRCLSWEPKIIILRAQTSILKHQVSFKSHSEVFNALTSELTKNSPNIRRIVPTKQVFPDEQGEYALPIFGD